MPISTINQNGLTNPLTSLASNTIQVSTGGSASAPAISKSDDTNTGMFFPAADTIAFTEGGAEAMRIDSSGRVGIGTSSPDGGYRLTVDGSNGNLNGIRVQGGVPRIAAWGDGSGTIGVGPHYYLQNVTGPNVWAAAMQMGPSSEIIFFQYPNGSWNERMRINSSGDLLVNTTTSYGKTTLAGNNSSVPLACWNAGGTSGFFTVISFRNNAGTSEIGNVLRTNDNTISFNNTSDYRLKENIAPMTGALAKVALLKPVTYTWKSDGSAGQGFIAHELQEIVPDAVAGDKDAINEDGSIKPQGIDTSFLVATLTAAIQELKAEFDAYKASHP